MSDQVDSPEATEGSIQALEDRIKRIEDFLKGQGYNPEPAA